MDDSPQPVDPAQIEADARTAVELRQVAALCGSFYDDCRAAGLPDSLAAALVRDWHTSVLGGLEVTWEADDD